MTNKSLKFLFALPLVALPASIMAQPVFTDPVGAVSRSLTDGLHVIGADFVAPIEFQGQMSSAAGSTISIASGDLSAFGGGDHYVEILSGAYAGLMMDIVSAAATAVTVSDPVDVLVGDESFAIRGHTRLSDILGSGDFGGAFGAAVILFDDFGNESQFVNSSSAGDWVDAFSGDFADPVIAPGKGFVLALSEPASYTSVGSVKVGPTLVPITGGFVPNVISFLNPASGLALGDSGLDDSIAPDQDVLVFLGSDGSETQVIFSGGSFIDGISGLPIDGSMINSGSGIFAFTLDSAFASLPIVYAAP
jgi:hypothetical protein